MNEPTSPSWEQRVEQLERAQGELLRACRTWKRRSWAAAAVGGLGFLLGAAAVVPTTLEAQNFVLRDSAGRMRAALAVRPDGTPGLGFFDETGRARISLELGAAGPSVNLIDGVGRPQVAMAVRPDGTPGIGLFDTSGRVRVSLDLGAGGSSGVNFYNQGGQLRAALAVRPDGTPALGFFNDQGEPDLSVEDPIVPPRPERIGPQH